MSRSRTSLDYSTQVPVSDNAGSWPPARVSAVPIPKAIASTPTRRAPPAVFTMPYGEFDSRFRQFATTNPGVDSFGTYFGLDSEIKSNTTEYNLGSMASDILSLPTISGRLTHLIGSLVAPEQQIC